MEIEQIKPPPVKRHMITPFKKLRRKAPRYIKSLVERTYPFIDIRSIDELPNGSVIPLEGGMQAACYIIKKTHHKEDFLVVKLRLHGARAEAEALEAWAKHGVDIPTVKAFGVVPETKKTNLPVRYLILECIVDRNTQPARPGADYAGNSLFKTESIGRAMGRQLARMHRAKSSRQFGEYADLNQPRRTKTWNTYLLGYLKIHSQLLTDLGFSEDEIKRLLGRIRNLHFPKQGVYVHGDYSLRNVMVRCRRPLKITIFDPNPVIGHPSWDFAVLHNNREFSEQRHKLRPHSRRQNQRYKLDHACLTGLEQGYLAEGGSKINPRQLYASQLAQMLMLVDIEIGKVKHTGKDPAKNLEVIARREALAQKARQLLNDLP